MGLSEPHSRVNKYLGQLQLDRIQENNPQKPISLYTPQGSENSNCTVLGWESNHFLGNIQCLAMSNDRLFIGTGGNKCTLKVISFTIGRTNLLGLPSTLLIPWSFCLFGQALVTNSLESDWSARTLTIWNLQSGKVWGSIVCSSGITALEIFNGDSIVAGFEDGSVRMWRFSPPLIFLSFTYGYGGKQHE